MPRITINQHDFSYRERGDGPVALFVHGFPLDSTMWLEQIDLLSDVRRCIVPDLRGFGESAPTLRSTLTMEGHAADLAGMIDAIGAEAVDLVGLSMGGYVALAFAESYPERIRTLALIDTRSTEDPPATREGRTVAASRVVEKGRGEFAGDMLDVLVAGSASDWIRARLRTMIEGAPVESIVAALEGMKLRPDRTPALEHLTVPVGVIVGEHDALTPQPDAEHMVAAAGASLDVIPDAGHMSPMERPEAVAAALRSLWAGGRVD